MNGPVWFSKKYTVFRHADGHMRINSRVIPPEVAAQFRHDLDTLALDRTITDQEYGARADDLCKKTLEKIQ